MRVSEIDLNDLVMAVRKAAANNPDFQYDPVTMGVNETCVYFDATTGEPSCIIGHGLYALGVTKLSPHANESGVTTLDGLNRPASKRTAAQWLKEVQQRQDGGIPWAEAVESADAMYGEI